VGTRPDPSGDNNPESLKGKYLLAGRSGCPDIDGRVYVRAEGRLANSRMRRSLAILITIWWLNGLDSASANLRPFPTRQREAFRCLIRARRMNVPNKLTISRFVLTAAFLLIFFAAFPYSDTVALALFSVAGLTDFFDGKIARRDNLITNFGILMDPLADKILICSAFIAFVERGLMPAWMVVIIVARELAITGLRLLAASKNLVLAAERYGQNKQSRRLRRLFRSSCW
jgi:CDP-diacylglycerol--glycerol-3-phosphate 3-phosphatidyltransferase